MRSSTDIFNMVAKIARDDQRIRLVLLNGSRANRRVPNDRFQDFDISFIVNNLKSFTDDSDWIDVFGNRLIMQLPDTMETIDQQSVVTNKFTYLMLFEDYVRIDLTIYDVDEYKAGSDSLSEVLVDKDNRFSDWVEASDKDYWIKKPTQAQFAECCNEFWWVSTSVMKNLVRKELVYSKTIIDGPIRDVFMLMVSWKVGISHNFKVNVGSNYKYLEKLVDDALWSGVKMTYTRLELFEIWSGLQEMIAIFEKVELENAKALGYVVHERDRKNAKKYIKDMVEFLE